MANITTHSQAQREVAQRFVAAFAKVEGEAFANDLVIVAKANHRFYITLPGDEGHNEYNYSGMKDYIAELEGREVAKPTPEDKHDAAVDAVAALAAGGTFGSAQGTEASEVVVSARIEGGTDMGESDVDGDGEITGATTAGAEPDSAYGGGAAVPIEAEVGAAEVADGVGPTAALYRPDSGADGSGSVDDTEGGVDGDAGDDSGGASDGGGGTDLDSGEDAEAGVGVGGDGGPDTDRDAGDDADGDVDSASGDTDDEVDEPENKKPGKKDKAKDKVKNQNKDKKKSKSSAAANLIVTMMRHSDAGSQGKLAMAEDLYDLNRISKEEGLNRNEVLAEAQAFFEGKGRKFPDAATRSRMVGVWQKVFADNSYGLDTELESTRLRGEHNVPKMDKADSDRLLPMPLGAQELTALYTVRNLFEEGEDEHNAAVLAMLNTFSYKTVQKVAPHLDFETFLPQFDEWLQTPHPVERENKAASWADAKKGKVTSDFKSLTFPAPTVDEFTALLVSMTEQAIEAGIHTPVEGKEASVSKTFVLDMLMATWGRFSDSHKVLWIKLHHGEISKDEYAELTGEVDTDIEIEGLEVEA